MTGEIDLKKPIDFGAKQDDTSIREKVASEQNKAPFSGNYTDGTNDSLPTKLGRVANVTLEGAANAVPGALHALKTDLTTKDGLINTAKMIGESAALGIVLRTALPETGMIAKTVGAVMGLQFAVDPVRELYKAGSSVWDDSSTARMQESSQRLGEGLGAFAVDGAIGLVAAGVASKKTPEIWKSLAPERWNKIETFKANWMGGEMPVAATLPLLGDAAKGSTVAEAAKGDGSDLSVAEQVKKAHRDLTPAQLKEINDKADIDQIVAAKNHSLYRNGFFGSNGTPHGLDKTWDLLDKGIDPETVKAEHDDAHLRDLKGVKIDDAVIKIGAPEIMPDGLKRREAPTAPSEDGLAKGDGLNVPPAELGKGEHTNWSKVVNNDTMSAQGRVTKQVINSVSDDRAFVTDNLNRVVLSVDGRVNPLAKRLAGYEEVRDAMINLAEEINTDNRLWVRAGDLMQRVSDAFVQSGSQATDVGRLVRNKNTYSRQNRDGWVGNIIDQQIDPKIALQRKIVSPLYKATSDAIEGGGHQGPHVVPAIYGPKGEPIVPVDTVESPVREIEMRGVQTSGIDGHELGHGQFGRVGEFDPPVRKEKLTEMANDVLGPEAKDQIELPNGGMDTQQVLLNNISRKVGKLEVDQREPFIAQSLGLDPQTRVIRGLQAADSFLGDAGRMQVQIPGQGQMPLELFLSNIAAMADVRKPSEVLAELRKNGNEPATRQTIEGNVNKILGANGDAQIPLPDGSKMTLREAVMKISDDSRNPKFSTFDQPLPEKVSKAQLWVNLFEGWANETFADWFAGSESGQSAAPYFQALRQDGKLSKGTVMGQELRSEDNPLGIEVHPVDKLRPRLIATLIRALAQPRGKYAELGEDRMLLDYADALDKYSREAGQTGDIVLANMDAPGKSIVLPEAMFDKFFPKLVDAQLNTPLPRLQGKTLFDILPDLRKNFRKNLELGDQWADAIRAGKKPEDVPFDAANNKQINIYGAGQMTFLKLVASGMDEMEANTAVNNFSDVFSDRYHEYLEKTQPAQGQAAATTQVKLQLTGRPHTDQITGLTGSDGNSAGITTTFNPSTTPSAEQTAPGLWRRTVDQANRFGNWYGRNNAALTAGYTSYRIEDLMEQHKLQQKILDQWDLQYPGS